MRVAGLWGNLKQDGRGAHMYRHLTRMLAISGISVVAAVAAAPAQADQLGVAMQSPAPEQGIPLTLELTGTANAIDQYGDGPYVYAVVRPAGGIGCQSSYGTDDAAAGSVSDSISTDYWGDPSEEVGPGSFALQTTYTPPNVGTFLICAWVETGGDDSGANQYPPEDVTAGPIAYTFTTRGPQVGDLAVALASPARPGVTYQINYTTQTDQQLTLESVVKPAGGLPCASSYELETQQNQSENDMFGDYDGTNVFGGPITTTATDTEDTAGPYVICTWIEGPDQGEVDAATATNIYIGTPPPPPPQSVPPPCIVPRYRGRGLSLVERRVIGHHCTIGRIRYVYSPVPRGTVLGLSAPVGKHLPHDARIRVFVSRGRRRG